MSLLRPGVIKQHKPNQTTRLDRYMYKQVESNQDLKSLLTLKVLVATIDAQCEGMGDVGSARYEPALLPPCPTIRVSSYSN